jgi:hypothetical protein
MITVKVGGGTKGEKNRKQQKSSSSIYTTTNPFQKKREIFEFLNLTEIFSIYRIV